MDRERSRRQVFLKTTVGQKVAMGLTGAVLALFVIGHVLGNLLVFRGRSELNRYSSLLHASSELLWSVRAVLLASVLVHIAAAWSLAREAHAARPIGYTKKVPRAVGELDDPQKSEQPGEGSPRRAA